MTEFDHSLQRSRLGALALVAAVLAGCASTPYTMPEFLEASFDPRTAERLAVAPVIDLRIDKTEALELDAWVHAMARHQATQRGYQVTTYADRGLIETLQKLPTLAAVQDGVKDVAVPGGPRHVLVFALVDAYAKLTFGSSGNAEMAGYLVDQQRREIVWRHNAVGQIGQGGLLGMAMKSIMTRSAIETATMKLVHSIPPREAGK